MDVVVDGCGSWVMVSSLRRHGTICRHEKMNAVCKAVIMNRNAITGDEAKTSRLDARSWVGTSPTLIR
jgi:hypothetical protein